MKKRMIIVVVSLLAVLFLLTASISGIQVTGKVVSKKLVTGEATTQSVGINISVSSPNNAPFIERLDNETFACENSFLEYFFNASDPDASSVNYLINPSYPASPFYINFESQNNVISRKYKVYSGFLNKSHAGGANTGHKSYAENISVNDGEFSDSKTINIIVLEVNNAPLIDNIGVQTAEVWTRGENNSFYRQVIANDLESGNNFFGNLSFSIIIANSTGSFNLFNISRNGEISFTANESQIGIYNVTIFASDSGLANPHANISLCGENGANKTSNQTFSLTVTDKNRIPYFESYYPLNASFNATGGENLYFNISKRDPDGTTPDSYWYVDGVFKEYFTGSLVDNFSYTFGCGISGQHSINVTITDGLINASLEWDGEIGLVACPAAGEGGGGGGGGGGASVISENKTCIPDWVCSGWNQCKNLEEAYSLKEIGIEERLLVRGKCYLFNWGNEFCGFQTRECHDRNNCPQEQPEKIEAPSEIKEENKTEIIINATPKKEIAYEEEMPKPSEKLSEEECVSDYSCTEWSDCGLNYNLRDIEENLSLAGEQYRDCIDNNKCDFDTRERRICGMKKDIVAKEIGGYVEVYDKEKGTLVSRLNRMPGQLSIQIPLDGSDYSPHCFDGIQNRGEEGIDCNYQEGKECPVCLNDMSTIKGDYILMWMTLMILVMSCFFLSAWYVKLGRKIKSQEAKILRISKPFFTKKEADKTSKQRELLSIIFISIAGLIFLVYLNSSFAITGNVAYGGSASNPEILKECYYTENPNCNDNIMNCHNGSCETETDCGGSCKPCPETCSDNVQNQGETGIDCGGPCPACYSTSELPTISSKKPFWLVSLIIVVLIIVLMIRLVSENKKIKESITTLLKK